MRARLMRRGLIQRGGQPGNGPPRRGLPGDDHSRRGQPGNGLPGNGLPGNGLPGNGLPGNSRPWRYQSGRRAGPPQGEGNPGWTVFSYLLSGMAVYGVIGWAVGHWVWHSYLFFPLGMLFGLLLAIILVYYRFGRSRL